MALRVAVDFDGVIHPYTKGWTGPIPDDEPPVGGVLSVLRDLATRYEVVVLTTRCNTIEGKDAVRDYLTKWDLIPYVSDITCEKVAATAYIDDRAVPFVGSWPPVLEAVEQLRKAAPGGSGTWAVGGDRIHDHDALLTHLVDEWGLAGVVKKLLDETSEEQAARIVENYRVRRIHERVWVAPEWDGPDTPDGVRVNEDLPVANPDNQWLRDEDGWLRVAELEWLSEFASPMTRRWSLRRWPPTWIEPAPTAILGPVFEHRSGDPSVYRLGFSGALEGRVDLLLDGVPVAYYMTSSSGSLAHSQYVRRNMEPGPHRFDLMLRGRLLGSANYPTHVTVGRVDG